MQPACWPRPCRGTSPLPEQPDTRGRPDPASSPSPTPRPGRHWLQPVRAPGSRAPGPGCACPHPGRPWPRHCGARRLAGRLGLSGHGTPAPLLPPLSMTGLLCRARKVRSGCGYVLGTGLPESPGTRDRNLARRGLFSASASSSGTKGRAEVGLEVECDCSQCPPGPCPPADGLPRLLVFTPMLPLVWDPH